MASPDFLSDTICPWYYHQSTGITDVNTIISDMRTALVTNLSWTEPTTALFQSPVDSAGRFMDVLATRISATNIEFRVRDFRGGTICTERIQIDATASVNYFAGKYYCVVESLRATPELLRMWILEQTPDSAGSNGYYAIAHAYRTAGDAADGSEAASRFYAFESGVAAIANRNHLTNSMAGSVITLTDAAGSLMYLEAALYIAPTGVARWAGRLYQAFFCDSGIAFATDKTVPIDDAGTTATFRVVGLPSVGNYRLCVRKA